MEKYKTYDTSVFIKYFQNQLAFTIESFYFSNLNICEWLRGKDMTQAKNEFCKIDKLIHETQSLYYLKNTDSKKEHVLNSSAPINYRYKIATKVAKQTFHELMDHYAIIVMILIVLVYSKVLNIPINSNKINIKTDNDYKFALLFNGLVSAKNNAKNALYRDSKVLFCLNKDDIDCWGVKLYNDLVDGFNKIFLTNVCYVETKHLSKEYVVDKNKLRFTEEDVDSSLNCLIKTKTRQKETVDYYKKLLFPVLIDGTRWEFNHLCDNYYRLFEKDTNSDFFSLDNAFARIFGKFYQK